MHNTLIHVYKNYVKMSFENGIKSAQVDILRFRKSLVGEWCLAPLSTIFQLYRGSQKEVKLHSNRSKNKLMRHVHVISVQPNTFCCFSPCKLYRVFVSGDS